MGGSHPPTVVTPRPILVATRMPASPREHVDAGMVAGTSPTRMLLDADPSGGAALAQGTPSVP